MSLFSIAKAIYGAIGAGLGAAATAYAQGGGHISGQSIFFIAITVVGSFGVIFGVPNIPKASRGRAASSRGARSRSRR